LPGQICTFLMNMHLEKRPIWLTRHGQSVYNVESRIGGGVHVACSRVCVEVGHTTRAVLNAVLKVSNIAVVWIEVGIIYGLSLAGQCFVMAAHESFIIPPDYRWQLNPQIRS
jgi:bisphosphoglycerate-dependent phosphoglycerate mutase